MPFYSDSGSKASNSSVNNLSFYDILEVSPQCSQSDIRDAYRRKSKQYHPDTTLIDKQEASQRFQSLNQAYETLRFPEKRQRYDDLLARKRTRHVLRSPTVSSSPPVRSSASLDPEDRALSAGEIFALFILGLTFLFCLLVAIFLGISRGEMLVQSIPQDSSLLHQLESVRPKSQAAETVPATRQIPDKGSQLQSQHPQVKPTPFTQAPVQAPPKQSDRLLFPPAMPH